MPALHRCTGSARCGDRVAPRGRMRTGDLAVMRDDAYCVVTGRIEDMIIRGGENLSPREIEDFLRTYPDFDDVQLIAVPDDSTGRRSRLDQDASGAPGAEHRRGVLFLRRCNCALPNPPLCPYS